MACGVLQTEISYALDEKRAFRLLYDEVTASRLICVDENDLVISCDLSEYLDGDTEAVVTDNGDGSITLSIGPLIGRIINLNGGNTQPATCTQDDTFHDRDDGELCICTTTNNWVCHGIDLSSTSISGSSYIGVLGIGTPTFNTQEELNTVIGSTGLVSAADVTAICTDGGGETVDTTALTGIIRSSDSHAAALYTFDLSASSGNAIPTDTTRFVGVEYNAGTPQIVVKAADTWNMHDEFALCSAVNEGGTLYILNNPELGSNSAMHTNRRFYETEPFERASRTGGLIIGETGTRNVTLTAGKLYDRNTEFVINAIDTSGADRFDCYSSAGLETSTQSQWDNDNYDNAGTLTTLTASKYANLWWWVVVDNGLICVYGTAQYATAALAGEEGIPPTLPDRISYQAKFVGRFVFQKGAGTANAIDSSFTADLDAAAVTKHSGLSDLGWAASNHVIDSDVDFLGYQLLNAEYTASGTNAVQREILAWMEERAVSVMDYGASGSSTKTLVSSFSGTALVVVDGSTFAQGHGIWIENAGDAGCSTPLLTQVSAINGNNITTADATACGSHVGTDDVRHDDTAAFNSANAVSHHLYTPDGNYYIGDLRPTNLPLTITGNDAVNKTGEYIASQLLCSPGATAMFNFTDPAPGECVASGDPFNCCTGSGTGCDNTNGEMNGIKLENLTMNGYNPVDGALVCNLMTTDSLTKELRIQNNKIKNFDHPWTSIRLARITDNDFRGNNVGIAGVIDSMVKGNDIIANHEYGVYSNYNSANSVFTANKVEFNTLNNLYLVGADNLIFSANNIDYSDEANVYLYKSWNVMLDNNIIWRGGRDTSDDWQKSNIYCKESSFLKLTGNKGQFGFEDDDTGTASPKYSLYLDNCYEVEDDGSNNWLGINVGLGGEEIYEADTEYSFTFIPAEVDISNDKIDYVSSAGLNNHMIYMCDPLTFTTTDTLPSGISLGTTYYGIRNSVSQSDRTEFQIATTCANAMAGTQVDITSQGVGTHTVTRREWNYGYYLKGEPIYHIRTAPANFYSLRYNGSLLDPTPVTNAQSISHWRFGSVDEDGNEVIGAEFRTSAGETYSSGGYGTKFALDTAANGETTRSTRFRVTETGDTQIIGNLEINAGYDLKVTTTDSIDFSTGTDYTFAQLQTAIGTGSTGEFTDSIDITSATVPWLNLRRDDLSIVNGNALGNVVAGWMSEDGETFVYGGRMQFQAAEPFTDSDTGTKWRVQLVPIDGVQADIADVLTAAADGTIGIPNDLVVDGYVGGNKQIIIKTATDETPDMEELTGKLITNGGGNGAEVDYHLPDFNSVTLSPSFRVMMTTASAFDWCLNATGASDNFILDGTIGTAGDCVCIAAPTLGAMLDCEIYGQDIYCNTLNGTWAAVAEATCGAW